MGILEFWRRIDGRCEQCGAHVHGHEADGQISYPYWICEGGHVRGPIKEGDVVIYNPREHEGS